MRAMTEAEVRAALTNVDEAERAAMTVPTAFYLLDWDHMDFVGWQDPVRPDRAYLIAETPTRTAAVMLRAATARPGARNGICDLCHCMQPGDHIALYNAKRSGEAGRRGDSIGVYICADLSCHDSVRLAAPLAPGEVRAGIDRRITLTRGRVERFVADIAGDRYAKMA